MKLDITNFTDNEFIGNQAVYGGAISVESPFMTLSIQNSKFINNSAVNGGGIYYLIPSIKVSLFY